MGFGYNDALPQGISRHLLRPPALTVNAGSQGIASSGPIIAAMAIAMKPL